MKSATNISIINASELNADNIIPLIEQSKVVFCDTETSGLDPYTNELLLVQIYVPVANTVYVIKVDGNKDEVARLFSDPGEDLPFITGTKSKPQFVWHNAKFDLRFLKIALEVDILAMNVYDTQLAECVLQAGIAESNLMSYTSLSNTAARRMGKSYKLDKSIRSAFINANLNDISDRMIQYAVDDVLVMRGIFRQQVKELKDKKLIDTAKLEFELTKHVANMELDGVLVEIDTIREVIVEQKKELLASKVRIENYLEPFVDQPGLFEPAPINLESPVQLLKVLKKAGLDLDDTSEFSLSYSDEPICDEILEYRSHSTLIKSFGDKLVDQVNPKTGRIHPSFHHAATATGRWSSSNPNMQQIPGKPPGSRLRDAFIAPPGKKIITADYSQIELRILAELSGDERMIDAYKSGFDGHTKTASAAFGVPLEAVDSEMRKVAKIINFATVYGGGPKAISKGLLQQITAEEAGKVLESLDVERDFSKDVYYQLAAVFIDNYFKELTSAKQWLDSMGQFAIDHLYTKTPIGRKRFYVMKDLRDENGEPDRNAMRKQASGIMRRGMNHPIQGCSADITKIAIINLGREFAKHEGCKILLQVHDEIVTEVPEELAEDMALVQVAAMENAAKVFLKSVPVAVDYNIGDRWHK